MEFVLSAEERARIAALVDRFDPATHELMQPWRSYMSEEEWAAAVPYMRDVACPPARGAPALGRGNVVSRSAVALARELGHDHQTCV